METVIEYLLNESTQEANCSPKPITSSRCIFEKIQLKFMT